MMDCGGSCGQECSLYDCAGVLRREFAREEALRLTKAARHDFADALKRLSSDRFARGQWFNADWEWVRRGLS